MNLEVNFKQKILKALVAILGLLVVCLAVYLLIFPFYPEIKYQLLQSFKKGSDGTAGQTPLPTQILPLSENSDLGNRLVIPKIGVDIPVVDSKDSVWALNRGAWRMPETSTPDKGSNTAIAGHRFKYLPPNNLTFYLLDKLVAGDGLAILWEGKEYVYHVTVSKIVPPTEISVLAPTEKPTITLITCDPIFSQKNRLIVTAELISQP
jgi:sortase A